MHQHFRFFGKQLSLSICQTSDLSQMKVLAFLHSIGVFTNFEIPLYLYKNNGLLNLRCSFHFSENSVKWQLLPKTVNFFKNVGILREAPAKTNLIEE